MIADFRPPKTTPADPYINSDDASLACHREKTAQNCAGMFADLSPWSFYDFDTNAHYYYDRPTGRKRACPYYTSHEGPTLRSGRVVRSLRLRDHGIMTWEVAVAHPYNSRKWQTAASARLFQPDRLDALAIKCWSCRPVSPPCSCFWIFPRGMPAVPVFSLQAQYDAPNKHALSPTRLSNTCFPRRRSIFCWLGAGNNSSYQNALAPVAMRLAVSFCLYCRFTGAIQGQAKPTKFR